LKWKLAVVAALAAVTTLCVAGVAGAARQAPGTTFRLVEKDEGFNFVDNKPTSSKHVASIGDMFAFTSSLWTPAHKRAGSLQASCVVTSGGKHPVLECTGTFALAGGQLELQTSMRDGANPTNIAIVGGTGAYEGALGSIKAVSRGENSPYTDDTVHLLPKAASA
jgi:hypothetical protein